MAIEVVERKDNALLADFIESNNFTSFFLLTGFSFPLDGPTMILFKNYIWKKKEGGVYPINKSVVSILQQEKRIRIVEDSLIIRAEIDLSGMSDIFGKPVTYAKLSDIDPFVYFFDLSRGLAEKPELTGKGSTKVIVKDVGQGSWNEILVDEKIELVFDSGTHYTTKSIDINNMFGRQGTLYEEHKPGLIISHWDVDHYHFLKAMSDSTISAFKFIICRGFAPTHMARVILSRILRLNNNPILLSPNSSDKKKNPRLTEFYTNFRFTVFNADASGDRNKSGITLLIRNGKSSVFLTADHHYSQLGDVLVKYLNYSHTHHLIVPHHGGNAGKFQYNLPYNVKTSIAAISVGNNKYGHPFPGNISALRSKRYEVKRTDFRDDIVIQL